MVLTNTLDEVFYIIFGLIEEIYWPIIGILVVVAFVSIIAWVGSSGRKR